MRFISLNGKEIYSYRKVCVYKRAVYIWHRPLIMAYQYAIAMYCHGPTVAIICII